jgi:hypothetical protein
MANFTIRVELHDAKTADDYEKLHAEMAKEGFSRTIQLTGGPLYQLPTAEYNKSGDTSTQVLELAKRAAARTGKKFSVLVTKADGNREWFNLTQLK